MALSVKVDPDLCISTGNCVRGAPEGFAFDDDDVSAPQPGIAALSVERLLQIARSCPMGAIHLYGEEMREIDQAGSLPESISRSPAVHPHGE